MTLKYILFDLDDTLYPRNTPIMPAIGERIKEFMMQHLGLSYEEASRRRGYYNYVYGTVIRGLLQEEAVDIDEYLSYVHDIPVGEYLLPNPELNRALARIPLRKYIFTNSYRKHAQNVMHTLGVTAHFEAIFDIQTVNFVSKPARHPYITVLNLLEAEANECVYIDDQARNLKEAKLLGMRTVLIDAEPNEWVDVTLPNIVMIDRTIRQFMGEDSND